MKKKSKDRKSVKAFWFCVEGECEKFYFDHLQKLINDADPKNAAEFIIKIDPNFASYIRSKDPRGTVFFVWDREGNSAEDALLFQKRMKTVFDADSRYDAYPGYTHLTFELWILLHFGEFCAPCSRKEGYLRLLNDHSSQKFESLKEYKQEKNFRKVLEQISLENVKEAVERGKRIREMKTEHGEKPETFGKFQTYGSNPDLLLHQCVEKILRECRPN